MRNAKFTLDKRIAWNGISLLIPGTWEIDGIDPDYLLIGQDNIQRIELKWTLSPGSRNLEQYVKWFLTKSQKQLGIQINKQSTPQKFIPENPCFDFFFFTWEKQSESGNGVLIYCRHCRRLTIIRFFIRFKWENAPQMEAIIQSCEDHSESGINQWDLFGITFSIPVSLSLKNFIFKPGYYKIALSNKSLRLSIYSWGPASFLLSGNSLSAFARQQIKLPQHHTWEEHSADTARTMIQWEFKNPLFERFPIEILEPIVKFTIFNITYHQNQNRIIGILVDAPKSKAYELMEKVIIVS